MFYQIVIHRHTLVKVLKICYNKCISNLIYKHMKNTTEYTIIREYKGYAIVSIDNVVHFKNLKTGAKLAGSSLQDAKEYIDFRFETQCTSRKIQ